MKKIIIHIIGISIFLLLPIFFTPPKPDLGPNQFQEHIDNGFLPPPPTNNSKFFNDHQRPQKPPEYISTQSDKPFNYYIFDSLLYYKIFVNILIILMFYCNVLILYPKLYRRKKYLIWGVIIVLYGFLVAGLSLYLWGRFHFHSPGFLLEIQSNLALYFTGIIASLLWLEYERRKQIQFIQVQNELKVLKLQMNPHFFFNSLNTIYSLSLTQQPKTPNAILILSDIMRYILNDANHDYVNLGKELKYVENYIEFQKLRLSTDIVIHFNNKIDPNTNQEIAPLIILPFIENAFKYGLNNLQENNNYIDIEFFLDQNQVFNFKIRNPINQSNKFNSTQIGNNNVKKRLELIYGEKANLKVWIENNFYCVHVQILL